jgi:hypothetical protein
MPARKCNSCAECAYVLLCWSMTVARLRCRKCHHTVLDTNHKSSIPRTQLVIVVLDCCATEELEWTTEFPIYEECPYCSADIREMFQRSHHEFLDDTGWRYVSHNYL